VTAKQFDSDDALERAMDVFWTHGYEATSMSHLLEAMGINRASLYATFGDKRALYLAAMARYDETYMTRLIELLSAPGSPKEAIVRTIRTMVDIAAADQERRGCMLTNTATELAGRDPEIGQRVAANLSRIESVIYATLVRARESGEIDRDRDLRALARFLMCVQQGVRVMTKLFPGRKYLEDIGKEAIRALG
jgi:TetR/AcrR family transcriptional repressor of nem operon